jgi:peptide deformylase
MSDSDVLPITQCGDPVLRRPAEPVDPADLGTSELQRLIAAMRATMEAAPGVGLAAPQVGVSLQLAAVQDGPERWGRVTEEERAARERNELPFTVLVNPAVRPTAGRDSRLARVRAALRFMLHRGHRILPVTLGRCGRG